MILEKKKFFINPGNKQNYIFNSSIQGIENADLILLVGCNPRHEATMVNARIRKSFLHNKTKIYSIGDPGDLTYDYTIIGNNTKIIKDIIEGKDNFTDKIKSAKNPMIIIGESALELSSGQFILSGFKNFLISNNLVKKIGILLIY